MAVSSDRIEEVIVPGDADLGSDSPGVPGVEPRADRGSLLGGHLPVPALVRRTWVLVAMTAALSMVTLDQTVVTVALPSMTRSLALSPVSEQWVVNAYVASMAATMAVGGRLGDRFGRVTGFRTGVVLFFLASAGCGLAPAHDGGTSWLLASRALQGVGAALMVPTSAAIVMSSFPTKVRGRAMAAYAGVAQVFLAVGPLLGGVLTETLSWRAVFWLNVPVGAAALVLVHLVKPSDDREASTAVPRLPLVLLVGGIGATVVAVQEAAQWGWKSPLTWTVLAGGVGLTTAFVVSTWHSPSPLVPLRMLAERSFRGAVVALGLAQFAVIPLILLGSLYLQDLLHYSPLVTGLAVLPLIVPIPVAAQLGGRWYDRRGVRAPAATGLALCTAGVAGWAAALPGLTYLPQVPGMVVTGLGLGLVLTPTSTHALAHARASERGQASGLVETLRQLGGTLGLAVVGAVVLSVDPAGTHTHDPTAATWAVTVGFGTAALVFGVATVTALVQLGETGARPSTDSSHSTSQESCADCHVGVADQQHGPSPRGRPD